MTTQQDKIESKIDQILEGQGKLITEIALINQRCDSRSLILTALDEDINGNGKAGLKQRLHDQEQAMGRIADAKQFSRPIVQRIITAAIIAVFIAAMSVWQDHRFQEAVKDHVVVLDPNSR